MAVTFVTVCPVVARSMGDVWTLFEAKNWLKKVIKTQVQNNETVPKVEKRNKKVVPN